MFFPIHRLAILLLLATCAVPAHAQRPAKPDKNAPPVYVPPPPTLTVAPVAMMIAGFDMNGDRRVDAQEYARGVAASFAAADQAKAGSLSPIDLGRWAREWLGDPGAVPGQFDFDTDNDDRVSKAEYEARFAAIFAERDRDKDGVLTRSELLTFGPACAAGPLPKDRNRRD